MKRSIGPHRLLRTALGCLGLGLATSGILAAQQVQSQAQTRASDQVVVFARAGTESGLSNGEAQLITYDESTGAVKTVLTGVSFETLHLVGHPESDRLRQDRPSTGMPTAVAPRIQLPQAASLYRVEHSEGSALVLIDAGGAHIVFDVATPTGDGLDARLHISPDGRQAIVATTLDHGGDLWLLDLTGDRSPVLLTQRMAPFVPADLRVGPHAAWFVSAGLVHVAELSHDGISHKIIPANVPGQLVPELVMSADGSRVGAIVEEFNDPNERHVVVFDAGGTSITITQETGPYSTPGYDHSLGPWMALDATGSLIAFRRVDPVHSLVLGSEELLVRRVDLTSPEVHITVAPTFDNYIDNVGVLGFQAKVLSFFAGDRTISGVTSTEEMGAADRFAADFSEDGSIGLRNVTGTSGVQYPPFDDQGTLLLASAAWSPTGERMLIVARSPSESVELTWFSHAPSTPGIEGRLEHLEQVPRLVALSSQVLIASKPDGTHAAVPNSTETHLLGSGPSHGVLKHVLDLPESYQLDRVIQDASSDTAALVAHHDSLGDLLLRVDLRRGSMTSYWSSHLDVSELMAFGPSGKLYLGLGDEDGGPRTFVAFDDLQHFETLPLPAGWGYPLPY